MNLFSQAVEVAYLQRSAHLAALANDSASVATLNQRMYDVSVQMERANWDLYSTTSPGPIKEHFHNSK